MRVVFLGNHTVGATVQSALAELGVLAGVVAHPPDPEDGTRYLSVFDRAEALGVPRVRAAGRDAALPAFVGSCSPDLLVVADYRYLLPPQVTARAGLGAINFHPSLLPAYRGRAPVNWAILRGERELGLTVHWIDEGMDTGDIIAQERYALDEGEDVGDALRKLLPLYDGLTRKVVTALAAGSAPRRPQDHARATAFPRRRPQDGRIDFSAPARDVFNLVRAVARPYPGAFGTVGGNAVMLWKTSLESGQAVPGAAPGTVLPDDGLGPRVQCADDPIRILEADASALAQGLVPGTVFDACHGEGERP